MPTCCSAKGMCEMTMDNGPKMTRAQVFAVAEERFTDAITRATAVNDQSILNMARVGRARARLDLKKLPEAAADAILVPAGFVRNAEFTEGGAAHARESHLQPDDPQRLPLGGALRIATSP